MFGLAFLVGDHSPPLCFYLIGAALCLFFRVDGALYEEKLRALEMHDLVLNQQGVAERFRAMHNQS